TDGSGRSRSSITAPGAICAIACSGCDGPAAHLTHAFARELRYEKVPGPIQDRGKRRVELSGERRPSVAYAPSSAIAGYGIDVPADHLTDAVVPCVRDPQVAAAIHPHPAGQVETREGRRASVATKTLTGAGDRV